MVLNIKIDIVANLEIEIYLNLVKVITNVIMQINVNLLSIKKDEMIIGAMLFDFFKGEYIEK